MAQKEPSDLPPPGWRFQAGIGFIVLGSVLPLLIPLVTASSLSAGWKTTISGILLVGVPEVCTFVAIAFLGKSGFNYIKARVFGFFKRAAPQAKVGLTRYRFGLAMWGLLALYGVLIYYAPDLIPGYDEHRVAMNLIADFLFVVSFFVLGGDFWDKFRALFIYDAKVIIPE